MSLRVLTVINSFHTGGVERTALRLVRRWRLDGNDAPLWVGRSIGAMAAEFADLDHCGPSSIHWPIGLVETLWMVAHLPGVIRRERPDVLFIPGNSYTVVAVLLKLWLGSRCPPTVATMSNDLDRTDLPRVAQSAYHLWLRVQGRYLDHFVALAPPMRRQTELRLRVPPERVTAIAHPALDDQEPPAEGQGRRFGRRLVFVGRLARQKDLPLLLRAFALGRRSGDTLTLIGNGPLKRSLRRLAARLSIVDAVDFAGFRSAAADDLAEYDALVLASRYEGLPAVVLEALEAGLAVVATDCSPALSELLEDLGTLVPVGDVEELARVIFDDVRPPHPQAALVRIDRHRIGVAAPLFQQLFAHVARTARATEVKPAPWRLLHNRPQTEQQ